MIETGPRDDDQRSRSLLSLGRALRGEEPVAPEPAAADAVTRHRLARSRRQARPSPLLVALAEADRQEQSAPQRDSFAEDAGSTDAMQPEAAEDPGEQLRSDAAASVAAHEPDKSWRAADFLKRWLPGDSRAADPLTEAPPASVADTPSAVIRSAPEPEREIPAASQWTAPYAAPPPGYAPRSAYAPPPSYAWPSAAHAAPQPAPAPIAEENLFWRPLIDPMKVISGVFNSKLIILGTTILGAVLGAAIAVSTPKKYEAFAELLIDPRDLKLADRDLTQTGLPSDATLAIIENQVRVLTSGTVLTKVVEKLNLTADPEFNGNAGGGIGIGEVIGILRSLLSRNDAPGAGETWRERAMAVQNLAEALKVERGGKTFVVSIGAKTEDPEKSALIANTLIDVFFQTYGEFQSNTAGRAADELTSRLDELRKSVEMAERKIETFKAENDIVDAQGRLITDDEILRLNEQLATARARTLELTAKAQSARSASVDNVVVGTLPEELASSTMTELRAQYARLKQDSDRLGVRLGPRHPERLAVEAQLAGAREQISAELRRINSSSQTELRRAVELEQQLAARLAQLKVGQGDRNSQMVTLRELEREANAKRAVYEGFLLRAREAGEARDVNTANMSVISAAYPPLDPVGPSRAMIALTGMVLGFFGGVGIGAARGAYWSFRENAARRADEAEGRSGPDDSGGGGRSSQAASPATEARSASDVPAPQAGSRPALDGMTKNSEIVGSAGEQPEVPYAYPPESSDEPEEGDDAMKYQAHPTYPGAQPYPAHPAYPYGYPMPAGSYGMPTAAPYPPHLAAAGYPVPPMPWPQQAMAPHAYYPYPPQPDYPYPSQPAFAAPGYPMPFAPAEPARAEAAPVREPANDVPSIEDIRATLREFRDAVRELTERRQRSA